MTTTPRIAIFCVTLFPLLFSCPSFSAEIGRAPVMIEGLKTGTFSVSQIVLMLHDKAHEVNMELAAGANVFDKKTGVPLKKFTLDGKLSLMMLLDKIRDIYGLSYDIDRDGVITIYEPAARKLGRRYPSDQRIDSINLKDVNIYEAIEAISQKTYANIVVLKGIGVQQIPGRKFSLILANVTIRDALTEIINASGVSGWASSATPVSKGSTGGDVMVALQFH